MYINFQQSFDVTVLQRRICFAQLFEISYLNSLQDLLGKENMRLVTLLLYIVRIAFKLN